MCTTAGSGDENGLLTVSGLFPYPGGMTKKDWARQGGQARAAKMTPQRRSEVARKAAAARWANRAPSEPGQSKLPLATHTGEITIGGVTLAAAVLEDKTRVLTQETFLQAIGRAAKAKGGTGSSLAQAPPFLGAINLQPFVSDMLMETARPLAFRLGKGGRGWGYRAELLPEVCEVYLQARDAGELSPQQTHIAKACDQLMRGLARVGIVALVDEATGYAGDRHAKELSLVLEAYLGEELKPWTKQFPEEFFQELYRLYGWSYEGNRYRPQYLGKLINRLVYDQLPPGVMQALKEKNPRSEETGHRKFRFHQLLSPRVGEPHLDRQVHQVLTLMKASETKEEFWENWARVFGGRKVVTVDVDAGRQSDEV